MPKPKTVKDNGRNPPSKPLRKSTAAKEREALTAAQHMIRPDLRHGLAQAEILESYFNCSPSSPGVADYGEALRERGDEAAKGDLSFASRILATQATTLDTIFSEMARRMACNMNENLGATETYARIALKAQANSRATLEALAKLHQPREQTVRHIHVNQGGQAVIADQVHHHHTQSKRGGQKYGRANEQPHATGSAGGTVVHGTALPSPDPCEQGVPVPGGQREPAVQDARRQR